MAMKMLVMSVLACLVMACDGDGGGGMTPLPTVQNQLESRSTMMPCYPFDGTGRVKHFRVEDGTDKGKLCFVDEVCYYRCPDDSV
jgi:hypothetical protein